MAVNSYNDVLLYPYSKDIKFQNFPNLDNEIRHHYDLIFDTVVENENEINLTPRAYYESKIGFRDIFYYIDFLYNNNPETIIDVGCGECIWKKWFPRIIGFDSRLKPVNDCDFTDFFDEDFSKFHQNKWANGMALNSIHFIRWEQILDQIDLAMNIIQNNFLFTFNFEVIKNIPNLEMQELVYEFKNILSTSNYKILLFDAPVLRGFNSVIVKQHSDINGTVRFILSKG